MQPYGVAEHLLLSAIKQMSTSVEHTGAVCLHGELDTQQKELQDAAIEFARTSLGGSRVRADREELFDHEGWKACANFGVLGMAIPREYGGLGLGLGPLLAVMEGLGYGTRDQGLLFSLNAHLWTNSVPLVLYGTDDQRRRYLPGLCD